LTSPDRELVEHAEFHLFDPPLNCNVLPTMPRMENNVNLEAVLDPLNDGLFQYSASGRRSDWAGMWTPRWRRESQPPDWDTALESAALKYESGVHPIAWCDWETVTKPLPRGSRRQVECANCA
jgi:hypothetical protein